MPQLAIETFVSQYFWLVITLFTFYYFIAARVIPVISEMIKTRAKLATPVSSVTNVDAPATVNGKAILAKGLNVRSNLYNSALQINAIFKKTKKSWIKKAPKSVKKTTKKIK